MILDAPKIETSRLLLRPHKVEDLSSCHEMWTDPKVYQHILGQTSTRSQTWLRILNYTGHWKLLGYGYWAVELKSSCEYIGELGFADFKREMIPSIEGIPEMGWALKSEHHGQGYAQEALRAVLGWQKVNLKVEKVACIISPDNQVSIHLAQSLGFQLSQMTSFAGKPVQLSFK